MASATLLLGLRRVLAWTAERVSPSLGWSAVDDIGGNEHEAKSTGDKGSGSIGGSCAGVVIPELSLPDAE